MCPTVISPLKTLITTYNNAFPWAYVSWHLSWDSSTSSSHVLEGVDHALNIEAAAWEVVVVEGRGRHSSSNSQGLQEDREAWWIPPWKAGHLWKWTQPWCLHWGVIYFLCRELPKCWEWCNYLLLSTYSVLQHSVNCCVYISSLNSPNKLNCGANCFICIKKAGMKAQRY